MYNLITTIENNQFIIRPEGKIMMDQSDTIKNKMKTLIQVNLSENKSINTVIIDLSSIDFVDSTGVGVFISLYKFSVEKKFHLTLIHPTSMVKKVFTITKLAHILDIKY